MRSLTIDEYIRKSPELQKTIQILRLAGTTSEQLKTLIREWNGAHTLWESGNGVTTQEYRSESGLVFIIKMDLKGNVRLDGGWQVKGWRNAGSPKK
jgi:hypothetical protein